MHWTLDVFMLAVIAALIAAVGLLEQANRRLRQLPPPDPPPSRRARRAARAIDAITYAEGMERVWWLLTYLRHLPLEELAAVQDGGPAITAIAGAGECRDRSRSCEQDQQATRILLIAARSLRQLEAHGDGGSRH